MTYMLLRWCSQMLYTLARFNWRLVGTCMVFTNIQHFQISASKCKTFPSNFILTEYDSWLIITNFEREGVNRKKLIFFSKQIDDLQLFTFICGHRKLVGAESCWYMTNPSKGDLNRTFGLIRVSLLAWRTKKVWANNYICYRWSPLRLICYRTERNWLSMLDEYISMKTKIQNIF